MGAQENITAWVKKLIGQVLADSTGKIISAERWNELWNLAIVQGDDQANIIKDIITVLLAEMAALTTHKGSADHDGRYFTEAEVTAIQTLLQSNIDTQAEARIEGDNYSLDTINTVFNNLTTHKTSADHDSRYFTEAEVTSLISTLQNQINTNITNIATVSGQIAALDATYSTDAERVAAVAAVMNAYQIADADLNNLITNKADKSTTYTKSEIDAMTLGSYKFGYFTFSDYIAPGNLSTTITVTEFDPLTDEVLAFFNGVYAPSHLYDIYPTKDFVLANGEAYPNGINVDLFIMKNIRVVSPADYIDGSMITSNSIQRTSLSPTIKTELDGLATTLAAKLNTSTMTTHQNLNATTGVWGHVGLADNTVTLAGVNSDRAVTPAGLNAKFMDYGAVLSAGGSFTLALTDRDKYYTMIGSGTQTITIPTNAAIPLPVRTSIVFEMAGTGAVVFAPAGGVTLRSKDNKRTIDGQYSLVTLTKVAENIWNLAGSLKA
jgi:hypothetical protein